MSETVALVGVPFENYTPPSWEEWFFKIMYLVAEKSKDPKTKIGAILVKERRIISTGYNGFCIGVNDDVPKRWVRPEKYTWVSHAERNAIYLAAAEGISTRGSVMYTNGTPCNDCAKAIIQAGVSKVVVHQPYENLLYGPDAQNNWLEQNKVTLAMFRESRIQQEVWNKLVGCKCYFDGKIFDV